MNRVDVRGSAGWVALFGNGGAVLGTFLLLGALACAVAAFSRSSRLLAAATGLALAAALALTVVPTGGWSAFALAPDALGSIRANLAPQPGDLSAWAYASDGPPNVTLFVPVGLSLALLLRRPLVAVVAATALSLAIECYQASLTTRVGSFADVVSNGLGAVLGAALAALLLAAVPSLRRHRPAAARAARPVHAGR